MALIQEIGSYAGLAAIVGLAVLSALYFSQARDVRRLRDWAGRAPERTTEPAAQPPRVVARPVPRPPGAQAGLQPVGGAAAPSAAGAAPAVATGPAAATPAAARAAGTAAEQAPGEGVSQDTMSHPPPPAQDGDGEEPDAGEELDDQRTDDSAGAVEDREADDEDELAAHAGESDQLPEGGEDGLVGGERRTSS